MKKLPINVHDFKELIDQDCYYVDKTKFIEKLINEYVVIYTRPKCFGKTLNISMLYYFFPIKEKDNAYLFDGLEISKNEEAMKYQNQYLTIFISLSDMIGKTMDEKKKIFAKKIAKIAKLFPELADSNEMHEVWKKDYNKYINECSPECDLGHSLQNLTYLLKMHYHKRTIILLDDYDTPLQVALLNGYYDKMLDFLRYVLDVLLKEIIQQKKLYLQELWDLIMIMHLIITGCIVFLIHGIKIKIFLVIVKMKLNKFY